MEPWVEGSGDIRIPIYRAVRLPPLFQRSVFEGGNWATAALCGYVWRTCGQGRASGALRLSWGSGVAMRAAAKRVRR